LWCQVTAVGLTAQARADGTKPSVYVDNFQACGDDFRTAPTVRWLGPGVWNTW
jgi:hypothetical protein